MNSGGGTGAPQENPVRKAYDSWAAVTPFTSRMSMSLIVVSYLLSFFINFTPALSNQLYFTIENLEVYRIVTSALCSSGFLSIIFALMSFNQIGPRLEGSIGSTGMMVLIFTLDVLSNVVFLLVCGFLVMFGQRTARFNTASGFWNVLLPLIAIEAMAMPEAPRRILFFPCAIPSKYYPLVLLLLFSFMSGGLRLDLACSTLVGYAYATGKLDRFKASRTRLDGWETGCLSNFTRRPGFIVGGSALGAEAWLPLNNPVDHPSNQQGSGGGSFGGMFGGGGGRGGGMGMDEGAGGESSFGNNNVIKRPSSNPNAGGGVEAFAGSGQTLGGGGRSLIQGLRGGGRCDTSTVDQQTARAARLAALEGPRANGTTGAIGADSAMAGAGTRPGEGRGGSTEPGTMESASLMENMDHEVMTLQVDELGVPCST
ncbi:unnamed protein product [Discosporangium mesarthrocarpum]